MQKNLHISKKSIIFAPNFVNSYERINKKNHCSGRRCRRNCSTWGDSHSDRITVLQRHPKRHNSFGVLAER